MPSALILSTCGFFSNVGSDSLCMFREIMDFKYFMGCLFFKKEIHDFSIGLC